MTIRSHPQQNTIETGHLTGGDLKESANFPGIIRCRLVGIGVFSVYAVNIFRWNRDAGEQGIQGHMIVALWMIRWNVAFIAPEKMDAVPGNPFAQLGIIGQQFIQPARCGTAGQRDAVNIARLQGFR